MNEISRYALVAVAVVAIGLAGAWYVLERGNGVGVAPASTPTMPSAAPAVSSAPSSPRSASSSSPADAPVDTRGWVTHSSARYGYSIKYPPEYEATAASRDWSMEQDRTNWLSPAQDQFIDHDASYQIGVHVSALDLPRGMSADQWIDAFLAGATQGSGCLTLAADMPTIEIGGYDGKLADQPACDTALAFVLVERRMYRFAIERGDQIPLFKAFLSTVEFDRDAANRLYTGDWTAYESSEYGFTLGHPIGWSEVPATRAWSYEEDGTDYRTTAADAFEAPTGDIRVSVWVVPFGPGGEPEESWENVETWVEAYCPKTNISSCSVIHDRAERLCIEIRDCHPGLLVPFDDETQAFFFGGVAAPGGMTVASVWRADDAAATARYGGSKRLLEAFIGTMGVWPEDRRPTPEDAAWPPEQR